MLLSIIYFFLLLMKAIKGFGSEQEFPSDLKTIHRSCDYICRSGACFYENCKSSSGPQCPGGACRFKSCSRPSCDGGGCYFDSCNKATCNGGGCYFINPEDVLEHGYCNGENCYLDGKPHPDFTDYLSI